MGLTVSRHGTTNLMHPEGFPRMHVCDELNNGSPACGDGILSFQEKRPGLRPGLCQDSPPRTLVSTTAMSATGVSAAVAATYTVSTTSTEIGRASCRERV